MDGRECGDVKAVAKEVDVKKLEEEVMCAKKGSAAKSNFLMVMSHEIRTPLHAIISSVDLLRETAMSESQHDLWEIVKESSQSLVILVDGIIEFSRIEAGALTLKLRPFQPRLKLNRIAALFQATAHTHSNKIVVAADASLPEYLYGDNDRILQILSNLVSNACKFTDNGTIELTGSAVAADAGSTGSHQALGTRVAEFSVTAHVMLEIRVRDTGRGMSAEALAGLFTSFFQGDKDTQAKFGGSGLGLMICKGLVDCMGGTIHVTSEVGVGSTFTVRLPLPVLQLASLPLPATEASPASSPTSVAPFLASPCLEDSSKVICIVDDIAINRKLLEAMLRKLVPKCKIKSYSSAKEVIDFMFNAVPNTVCVIFMDIHMYGRGDASPLFCSGFVRRTGLDGFGAAKIIREREIEMQIQGRVFRPVFICAMVLFPNFWLLNDFVYFKTADASAETKTMALQSGMNVFITKPAGLEDMRGVLESVKTYWA